MYHNNIRITSLLPVLFAVLVVVVYPLLRQRSPFTAAAGHDTTTRVHGTRTTTRAAAFTAVRRERTRRLAVLPRAGRTVNGLVTIAKMTTRSCVLSVRAVVRAQSGQQVDE